MTATIIHFLPDRTDLQRSPTGKEAIPSRDSHPVHRVRFSRAVTAAGESVSPPALSPAPFSPLECDAPTGSRTEGRSPTDRLNRDKDGLAMFSPWTVSRDHWWRA